ncbi:MAG: DUF58 domain-containing protein [Thiomonas sp. 20-64-9]|jgi:uncharacterized protein (DUF58 family)|uniref:DUF58 domain-containing protein n=1 Tax=unclassified Thiomonas TaxID=2625466 RepID=UPI000BC982F6|nr:MULTISPECIES: DUF58 domain-containing protein [unclassified Thiomonas]OYV29743.1 MAG: DUF58 domain-containing protein [Thiomonas sp. 20-64-9]OZB71267.1 MAG: DUF58 domain-containing protein [Thiomonas sp. 13-64-67]
MFAIWRREAQDRDSPQASRPLLLAADAAALIARARGLRLAAATQPVSQRAAGDSRSRWTGRGLDYAESRAYQPGDDLRDLHWRLLARTGRPYVKVHREEHAPALHLLLDLRPGMVFGTRVRTKAEQAARMLLLGCAAQALAAEGAAGALGLSLWRGPVRSAELGRGLLAVQRLAQRLQQERIEALQPDHLAEAPETSAGVFAAWAQRLARTLPEGARVLLASDGAGWDAPDIDAALWTLRSRVEVLLLRVTDPAEAGLPADAALDGAIFVDLARQQSGPWPDAAARAAFSRRAAQHRTALLARWRARGLRCIAAGVDQSDVAVLRALRVAGM